MRKPDQKPECPPHITVLTEDETCERCVHCGETFEIPARDRIEHSHIDRSPNFAA